MCVQDGGFAVGVDRCDAGAFSISQVQTGTINLRQWLLLKLGYAVAQACGCCLNLGNVGALNTELVNATRSQTEILRSMWERRQRQLLNYWRCELRDPVHPLAQRRMRTLASEPTSFRSASVLRLARTSINVRCR